MKNFIKTSVELINGNAVIAGELMPRSLVLFNEKGAVYNIAAKVRNWDKFTIVKALAKAILASLREANALNATDAAKESKKRVVNKITPALSCYAIMVTDKNGNLSPDKILSVRNNTADNGKLRDVIRITRGMPLYKLVVEQGRDWADEMVVRALNVWTKATIEQMDYVKNLDEALGRAADSNVAEYAASLKAEREAIHAKNAEKQAAAVSAA